jgi:hypothetical protein
MSWMPVVVLALESRCWAAAGGKVVGVEILEMHKLVLELVRIRTVEHSMQLV